LSVTTRSNLHLTMCWRDPKTKRVGYSSIWHGSKRLYQRA